MDCHFEQALFLLWSSGISRAFWKCLWFCGSGGLLPHVVVHSWGPHRSGEWEGISWESGNGMHLHVGSTHTGPQGNQPGGHLPARNKGQLVVRGQRQPGPRRCLTTGKLLLLLHRRPHPRRILPPAGTPSLLCSQQQLVVLHLLFLPFARGRKRGCGAPWAGEL